MTFRSKYIPAEITDMTMQPQPVRPIPMWFGAARRRRYRRTVRIGDGWHGSQLTPEEAGADRQAPAPRPARAGIHDLDAHALERQGRRRMRERVAAYAAVGVQHVMVHPQDREIDDWDEVIEGVGRLAAQGI